MNYVELKNLALSYSDRQDKEVSDRLDDFLRMVEARVNRHLKVQEMSHRVLLTTKANQEYYSLPVDFSGLRDIEIRDELDSRRRMTLKYMSPEQLNNESGNPGTQIYYTIVANQLQIMPPQEGKVMEVVYYRKVIPLSTGSPTNWLSEFNPDTYLSGLMVEINAFIKDANTTQLWDARFRSSLNEIKTNDSDSRWSGTALEIRIG